MRRVVEESTVPRAEPAVRTTPPAAAPPRQLGRYQLLFELARGGIGVVYVGRLMGAHGFDRLVAIKRLSAAGASEEEIGAFLDEARLTARINHPNVVQTLELGDEDGAPFIVMQLVEGVSLARLLRNLAEEEQAVEPQLAAWIVAQAAAGLHAAHELRGADGEPLGLVHRDVSPENVILSFDGRVYVADFGVAKLTESGRATQTGVVKGKFAYMSPEQTRAGALDRRSDVFSLGVVLHEALSGRRLFAGSSPADTIRRIGSDHPPDPRDAQPAVPATLVPLVMRCLEKRREDRFATAGELADALRRALRERGAPTDESDLAALLTERFRADRDKLAQRIRAAVAAKPGEGDAELAAPELTVSVAGRSGTGSVTAAVTSARGRGRWFGTGALLTVLALGGGAAWLAGVGRVRPAPSDAAAAPSPSEPSPPDVASPPAASPEAPPPPVATPPAPEATSPPPPQQRAAPITARPPRGRPTSSEAPPPAASSAAPSHKGVPFRDLD